MNLRATALLLFFTTAACGSSSNGNDAATDAGTVGDAASDAASDVPGSDAPTGFACGSATCDRTTQYCSVFSGGPQPVDGGASSGSHTCVALPTGCSSAPTCDCLSSVTTCGSAGLCAMTDGALTYTCNAP